MRIISGKHRGMKLAEFSGKDIRPTADRVKESLFNILGSVEDFIVLDLFCGSGNVGIECLSRGAALVHFNDISKESVAVLNGNLKRLKENNYKVTNCDYARCLSAYSSVYDFIFIDPPYKSDFGISALEIIAARNLLKGVAVLERDCPFSGEVKGLTLFDERKYGKTYLSFFKNDERE